MSNKLFVVTGPSGAGLRDIVGSLFETRSDVSSVLPVTARKMRVGEKDGVGFRFYDLEGWKALISSGDLLEKTVFAGNDYGTSRTLVDEILKRGKNVILNVDVERASQIKKNMPEAVCVYIEPSADVLEERYRKSARSKFEVSVRIHEAAKQRELSYFCDCRICSDDTELAEEELNSVIDESVKQ